jgi:hypothetical protein
MQILEVDPSHPAVNLLPVRALDRAWGRETTSSLVSRFGAVAGVNGGYFAVGGPWSGAPANVYQWHGEPLGSGTGRTALIFCEESDGRERLAVGVVNFSGKVRTGTGTRAVKSLNSPPAPGELAAFRCISACETPVPAGTTAAIISPGGAVRRPASASVTLEPGAVLLAGRDDAARWIESELQAGSSAEVSLSLSATPCKATDIAGAGPRLVRGGRLDIGSDEKFAHENVRHPRTAVAVSNDGVILFVTVDGRQPASQGMTLEELGRELVLLGALEAINMDGGGSTVMVAGDAVRNAPSDGSERPVGDAILIFSVPDQEALSRLERTLDRGDVPDWIRTALLGEARRSLEAALPRR